MCFYNLSEMYFPVIRLAARLYSMYFASSSRYNWPSLIFLLQILYVSQYLLIQLEISCDNVTACVTRSRDLCPISSLSNVSWPFLTNLLVWHKWLVFLVVSRCVFGHVIIFRGSFFVILSNWYFGWLQRIHFPSDKRSMVRNRVSILFKIF